MKTMSKLVSTFAGLGAFCAGVLVTQNASAACATWESVTSSTEGQIAWATPDTCIDGSHQAGIEWGVEFSGSGETSSAQLLVSDVVETNGNPGYVLFLEADCNGSWISKGWGTQGIKFNEVGSFGGEQFGPSIPCGAEMSEAAAWAFVQ
jgi:hypothetical protein